MVKMKVMTVMMEPKKQNKLKQQHLHVHLVMMVPIGPTAQPLHQPCEHIEQVQQGARACAYAAH